MTPTLFHGPEARDSAVLLSEERGRPVRAPMGDSGLKVDDSRLIVELATLSGVGDKPPSLVIGPIDGATPEAADALLKTLEDLTEAPLRLVLWADHLAGVIPTIRSRTRAAWCPPGLTYQPSYSYLSEQAQTLCVALLKADGAGVLGVIEDTEKDEWLDLLQAVCEPLAESVSKGPEAIEAWLSIRSVLDGRGSLLTAADALLPEKL